MSMYQDNDGDLPRRRSHPPNKILELLGECWLNNCRIQCVPSSIYSNDDEEEEEKKEKTKEGQCHAIAFDYSGCEIGKGKFCQGQFHAEMDALFGEEGVGRSNLCDVQSLHISAPPCPRCAVILNSLGVFRNKICAPMTSQRLGPSSNWPPNDKNQCVQIITRPFVDHATFSDGKTLEQHEVDNHIAVIFSHFQGGAWCNNKKKRK